MMTRFELRHVLGNCHNLSWFGSLTACKEFLLEGTHACGGTHVKCKAKPEGEILSDEVQLGGCCDAAKERQHDERHHAHGHSLLLLLHCWQISTISTYKI